MDQTPTQEAPQPFSEDSSSPPVQNSPKRKPFFVLVGFTVFATIAVVFSSILLNNTEDSTSQNIPSGAPTNTLTSSPTPLPTQTVAGTKLNIAEGEMFFIDQLYPVAITNLPEATLIGFSCGETYLYQYNPDIYVYWETPPGGSITGSVELNDPAILEFLTRHNNQQPEHPISAVQKCILDTNQTILILDIAAGGGGMDTIVRVGYFENNELGSYVTIENRGDISAPYFTFERLLAVTTDNYAFLQIHGGDAYFGRAAIIKVDLSDTAEAPTPIYICTFEMVNPESNDEFPDTKTSCT